MPNPSPAGLLKLGRLAGPLYVGVGTLEVLFREGFDVRRHALSLMSNGPAGWIQIATFITSGILVTAGALGLRAAWQGTRGGTWAPWLLILYGVGLIGAGIFIADPMDGFPPGTPVGPPAAISWHGTMHFVAGGIGFYALIAAALISARHYLAARRLPPALFSASTAILFFIGFAAIASGRRHPAINLGFTAAVVLVWLWLTWLFHSAVHETRVEQRARAVAT